MRRRMTLARKAAAVLVAPLLAASAVDATGAVYRCNVPRALLCEGCASEVAITLLPSGACRVSFTPPPVAGAAAPAGQRFSFSVETYSAPAVRRRIWRANATPRPLTNGGHGQCFVFNGNQYCE
jgi:hypothetical protein